MTLVENIKPVVKPNSATLLAALACGVAFDVAVHTSFNGVGGALLFLIVPLALFLSGRVVSSQTKIALAIVPLFGVWMAVRTSPALLVPNVLCVLTLLAVAGLWSRAGSPLRATLFDVFEGGLALIGHALFVPEFVVRALPVVGSGKFRQIGPIVTGLVIAVPVALVLGLLLASADSVFASLFDVDIDLGSVPEHAFAIGFAGVLAVVVLRAASSRYERPVHPYRQWLGFTEMVIVLGTVVVLYAVFVVTQIVVWLGGADKVLQTAGVSYADHARQGFFQLIAVSVLTLLLLRLLRRSSSESVQERRIWLVLSLSAVALTLAIAGIAVQRLSMYESAYGLTMMRLYASIFVVWLGAVFVFFGLTQIRTSYEPWFFGVVIASGMVVLLAMNVVNPERVVVNRNIDRLGSATVPFDVAYLAILSADGAAALAPHVDRLNAGQREEYFRSACPAMKQRSAGLSFNLSRSRAEKFWKSNCSQR